jgi:iron complex outermembrane receptor protein
MYKKSLYLTLILFLICEVVASQNKEIDLKEVVVVADSKKKPEAVGTKITELSQIELNRNRTKSLSELLLEASSIQIKSMGQGAMATASFRGTAASHTQVLWNGISLNSPQLGSFDFSQIPIYFVDNVTLHHGGSAQSEGSGALGGSVNFSNAYQPLERPNFSFLTEVASNQTFTEALTAKFTKKNLTSATRIYYQQSENNFRYLNKVYSSEPTYERREDADYKQSGVMQELYYHVATGDLISAIGWWQYDDRSLPQFILGNSAFTEQSKTQNIRTRYSYEGKRKSHSFKTYLSYLNGSLKYQRSALSIDQTDTQLNKNNTFLIGGEYGYKGFKKIDLSTSLFYRLDNVSSDNFENGSIARNTASLKLKAAYRVTKTLHLDASVTTEQIDADLYSIYNISGRYRLIDQWLTLKASNSYNYRTPSLNDLYWLPGGNPDLKPEKGWSSDISLVSEPTFGPLDLKMEATYYHMDIDNWIMWVPKGNGYIWEPVNFSKVKSQGVEFATDIRLKHLHTSHLLTFNYGYTRSVDNSGKNEVTQGKQLPYVPRNRWNAGYHFAFKDKLWAHYNASFTDARFITADESYQTNAYTTHNIEVGYNLKLKRHKQLTFSLKVDNLFNAYYESTQYYPMPLRMFWGKLVFEFN